MSKSEPKKFAPLRILEILKKYSDEHHPLSQEDIALHLSNDYGIALERKAIGRNVALLKESGVDIAFTNKMGSYYNGRDFLDSELRLLMDGVRFSKYIKKSYSNDLIQKLLEMGTPSFRERMESVKYFLPHREIEEDKLFLCIGDLSSAIIKNKKVEFRYLTYDVKKELSPVWGEKIKVTPKELVATNGDYYLIGLIEGNDQFTNFRVERIRDIEKSDESGDVELKFDLNDYLATHPLMWCGQPVTAVLKVSMIIMNDIIDFFGKDFAVKQVGEDKFEVTIRATDGEIEDFALRNAGFAEVISPDYIRQRIKRNVRELIEKYGV